VTPLIDGDILAYEIPFACEYGKEEIPSFDYVYEVLQSRIEGICNAVNATEKPILFLTGKGTTGYEADDAMAIQQCQSEEDKVICSRDKDLRMVPGYHYGWESGKQGEFDLQYIDEIGYLELNVDKKKVEGGGILFFYAQMLMGDTVDNIPGCKGIGYKKAYELLNGLTDPLEMEEVVWHTYKEKHPDKSLEELRELFIEQGRLLWMIREMDEEGNLVHWEPTVV